MLKSLLQSAPRIAPADAAGRLRSGHALLVDVREASECRDGVAESAVLLPLSDLTHTRAKWAPFLASVGERELLLYCASGTRSGVAARVLVGEGVRAFNAGGLRDWIAIGWPVLPPSRIQKPQRKENS